MRALLEERLAAEVVAKVVVLPGFASGRCAGHHRVAVDQHLNGAHVAGEVAGVGVGLGQRVRGDPGVVLDRFGRPVAELG